MLFIIGRMVVVDLDTLLLIRELLRLMVVSVCQTCERMLGCFFSLCVIYANALFNVFDFLCVHG